MNYRITVWPIILELNSAIEVWPLMDDIEKWCNANIGRKSFEWECVRFPVFAFRDEESVSLFKLKYSKSAICHS